MDLHTAGHRRGVVAAPHHAAAEAGRAILAEGGNALEAMVAMAATIAAVYPHMNHVGGDGFFLVRERSGRVRALMAAGRAGAKASIELLSRRRARLHPGARAARRAHGAGGGGGLDARARSRQEPGRPDAARDAARGRHPPRPRRLWRHPEPGAAHQREARRTRKRTRLCGDVPRRRQAARGGYRPHPGGAGRHLRSSRQGRARRFLPRRCRPRDRRRSRTDRQPGDPRRPRSRPCRGSRAAEPHHRCRHAL